MVRHSIRLAKREASPEKISEIISSKTPKRTEIVRPNVNFKKCQALNKNFRFFFVEIIQIAIFQIDEKKIYFFRTMNIRKCKL